VLTLTRRKGESLNIGLSVEITVLEVTGGRVRLGIAAPRRLPVHRGEVVTRMELANQSALANWKDRAADASCILYFADGLIGLPEHKELLMCEANDDSGLHVLVSKSDPCIQLAVIEAQRRLADYPIRDAQAAAGFEDEEVAVALVVTQARDGVLASVNLQTPVVIGMVTRRGAQVILWREDLTMHHPLALPLAAS